MTPIESILAVVRPIQPAGRAPSLALGRRCLRRLGLGAEWAHLPRADRAALAQFAAERVGPRHTMLCGRRPACAACPLRALCPSARDGPRLADLPHDVRPRERLLRDGESRLTDADLLAVILGTGGRGLDVVRLATALLARYGSLRGVAEAPVAELACTSGVGPAKAARLKAALEASRRLAARPLERGARLRGIEDVAATFRARYRDARRETCIALLLDAGHRLIREVPVSVGTVDASLVVPRDALAEAVRESAAAVIFVHNHPSGRCEPSEADRRLTTQLELACRILGIEMLDHVVVADDGYASVNGGPRGVPSGAILPRPASP